MFLQPVDEEEPNSEEHSERPDDTDQPDHLPRVLEPDREYLWQPRPKQLSLDDVRRSETES